MLTLSPVWNLLFSTIVFFIAAWYVRRYLLEQGIQKGLTFAVVVFTFAALASFGAGEILGWVGHRIEGPKPIAAPAVPAVSDTPATTKDTPPE